jgi:hypothetical protein
MVAGLSAYGVERLTGASHLTAILYSDAILLCGFIYSLPGTAPAMN